MKLTGGVIGLTENQAALHPFCLVAPFLSALSKEFYNKNQITTKGYSQDYQMTSLTNQRISSNVKKNIVVFHTFNFDFKDYASVFNAVSKVVLPAETATDLLNHEYTAKEMHKSFVGEKIKGEVSVWSTIKKHNLETFRIQGKSIKTKIGEKLVLLSRFLITARKTPELDLEGSIRNYEFAVVAMSIFTPDGQPLHSFLHAIE